MRMKDEDWQAILDTNLSSVYRTSKAVMRGMMKARKGRIISIASVIGLTGNPGQANYAAAKAGIIALSKSLARESTVLAYRRQWMPSYAVPPAAAITLLMPYERNGSAIPLVGRSARAMPALTIASSESSSVRPSAR